MLPIRSPTGSGQAGQVGALQEKAASVTSKGPALTNPGWGPALICVVFQIEQICGVFWRTLLLMRMNELTPKQFSSVPCPTCGVAAGETCLLHSGGLRSESHIDRKLCAAEAMETKKIRRSTR
jgi:hypothetical protein